MSTGISTTYCSFYSCYSFNYSTGYSIFSGNYSYSIYYDSAFGYSANGLKGFLDGAGFPNVIFYFNSL